MSEDLDLKMTPVASLAARKASGAAAKVLQVVRVGVALLFGIGVMFSIIGLIGSVDDFGYINLLFALVIDMVSIPIAVFAIPSLLELFGVGMVNGIPDINLVAFIKGKEDPKFDRQKAIDGGWNLVRLAYRAFVHVLYFLNVLFVTQWLLGLANLGLAKYGIVVTWVVLFALGAREILWPSAKPVYKNITTTLLLAAFVIFLADLGIKNFTTRTQAAAKETLSTNTAKADDNDATTIKSTYGTKAAAGALDKDAIRALETKADGQAILPAVTQTFTKRVLGWNAPIAYTVPPNIAATLAPICGIPDGDYMLDLADNTPLIHGIKDASGSWSHERLDLKDWTRKSRSFPDDGYPTYGFYANGVRVGEKIHIEGGCIVPSFNLSHEVTELFRNGTYRMNPTSIGIVLR